MNPGSGRPGAFARAVAAVCVIVGSALFAAAAEPKQADGTPVLQPRLAHVRVGDWYRYRERPYIVKHSVRAVETDGDDVTVRFLVEFFDENGFWLTASEMAGSLSANLEFLDALNRQMAEDAFPWEWREVDIGGKTARVLAMTLNPGRPDEIEAWWSEEVSVTGLVMRKSRDRRFEDMVPLGFGSLQE